MTDPKPRRIRMSPGDAAVRALCTGICLLFLLIFVLPVGYVLLASVHSRGGWSLEGYALLLRSPLVLSGLKNSLFLAGAGTAYSLCLEIPAAYVLSKKRYGWLTNVFFALGQFGAALLPLYLLLKRLGLLNSLWGLILPSGLSVCYTQLLRARMLNLSAALEDAAALDGCGPLRYLWQICLPLIGPTVGCLAFFHACGYWGNTLYARTFLTDESRFPLSLVLNAALIQNRAGDVLAQGGAASAAAVQMAEFALCVLSALPMIVLFLLLKRQIRSLDLDSGLLP